MKKKKNSEFHKRKYILFFFHFFLRLRFFVAFLRWPPCRLLFWEAHCCRALSLRHFCASAACMGSLFSALSHCPPSQCRDRGRGSSCMYEGLGRRLPGFQSGMDGEAAAAPVGHRGEIEHLIERAAAR